MTASIPIRARTVVLAVAIAELVLAQSSESAWVDYETYKHTSFLGTCYCTGDQPTDGDCSGLGAHAILSGVKRNKDFECAFSSFVCNKFQCKYDPVRRALALYDSAEFSRSIVPLSSPPPPPILPPTRLPS